MLNRIAQKLEALEQENRAGLVSFVMAGDPNLAASKQIIETLIASGSDIIEIGMPFSDPVADGPTIQASAIRALKENTSLKTCLKLVEEIRITNQETPLILMGYLNPILKFGLPKFLAEAKKSGVDAMLIVDLPVEEAKQYFSEFQKHNINLIQLISPNTDNSRIKAISDIASGFIYYISVNAITGTKKAQLQNISTKLKEIRQVSPHKIAVGFGIDNKEQADEIAESADLIVIGSKYIKMIEAGGDFADILSNIKNFNKEIRSGKNLKS